MVTSSTTRLLPTDRGLEQARRGRGLSLLAFGEHWASGFPNWTKNTGSVPIRGADEVSRFSFCLSLSCVCSVPKTRFQEQGSNGWGLEQARRGRGLSLLEPSKNTGPSGFVPIGRRTRGLSLGGASMKRRGSSLSGADSKRAGVCPYSSLRRTLGIGFVPTEQRTRGLSLGGASMKRRGSSLSLRMMCLLCPQKKVATVFLGRGLSYSPERCAGQRFCERDVGFGV
jgi:hypothetical protein